METTIARLSTEISYLVDLRNEAMDTMYSGYMGPLAREIQALIEVLASQRGILKHKLFVATWGRR